MLRSGKHNFPVLVVSVASSDGITPGHAWTATDARTTMKTTARRWSTPIMPSTPTLVKLPTEDTPLVFVPTSSLCSSFRTESKTRCAAFATPVHVFGYHISWILIVSYITVRSTYALRWSYCLLSFEETRGWPWKEGRCYRPRWSRRK